jgi:two-component system sensor histidine kinase DesK
MTLEAAGIRLDFRSTPYDLDPDQESVVALALREAVTNVVRHAKADTCRVRLRSHKSSFELEVEDDGRGSRSAEGSGLTGMRERVEALGGEVVVESAGRGTRIRARLPTGQMRKEHSQPDALERPA